METYNNTLCISHTELTSGIMSASMVKYLRSGGRLKQARKGGNGREALFTVDSLPYKYKAEVYKREPDLKAQAESKPFIETIVPDGAAMNFYETYTLPNGRYLPKEKREEYANNAAILNTFRSQLQEAASMCNKQTGGKRSVNKTQYWNKMAGLLSYIRDKYPHTLPENPRRLQDKYNQYVREGYAALITGRFGTRNAAKVNDDIKESLLVQLIADARNLDNAQIADLYNLVAGLQQWAQITPDTVRRWREKNDLITAGGRLGATRFRNQKTMQAKRERPALPLLYWTLDGWTAELLYQKTGLNKKGGNVTTYTNRLTLVVVLDPCYNYPIGYAIGTHENPALIKEALRDAANHTAELFGQRYRTNQLQSDNYGRGALTPLYQTMGDKYTPARAHNAKAKVIEPYFYYLNKTYCQYFKNWAGFGITSNKNLQPNSEFINKHRHSFPDEKGCREQLTMIIEQERAKKREQYVSLFAKLSEERKLPLTDEQYLLSFGADNGQKNSITGQGLRITIGGEKRDYDCFDPRFREHPHVRWTVKYDPTHLDRVLAVNDDETLRFVLECKYVQPMALAERKEGDAEQLERVRQFNEQLEENVTLRLADTRKKVELLFQENPQLDVATRLLLTDSNGQNKPYKSLQKYAEDTEPTTDNQIGDTAYFDRAKQLLDIDKYLTEE